MGWGNVTGMRVDGQLLELETGLCLVSSNWERVYRTWKEVNRQRHRFARVDCTVTVTGRLDSVCGHARREWTGAAAWRYPQIFEKPSFALPRSTTTCASSLSHNRGRSCSGSGRRITHCWPVSVTDQ